MNESPHAPKSKSFSSAQEVFCYLRDKYKRDGDGDMNAIALFAYALVEKDRVDWSEHLESTNGTSPTHEQTVEWFRSKPDSYFSGVEKNAYSWFTGFARALLGEEIEETKQSAVRDALGQVHEELAALRRFWPAFWSGNLVGITSNLGFALLIVLFVFFISSDFSVIAWSKRVFSLGFVPPPNTQPLQPTK